MKPFHLFFFLFLLSGKVFSQTPAIDSLKKILDQSVKDDTNRVNTLIKLSIEYAEYGDYKTGISEAQQASTISKSIGFNAGEAHAYRCLGNIYRFQGEYTQSLEYYLKGLKIFEQQNDKQGIVRVLYNIGHVYFDMYDYSKALEYYQKGLLLAEELKDESLIYAIYVSLAGVYSEQKDYDKTLEYLFKTLEYYKTQKKLVNQAIVTENIGKTYYAKEDARALDYFFEALNLMEKLENKRGIEESLSDIGYFYLSNGKQKEAEEYLTRAILIATEIGDLPGAASLNNSLSRLYGESGDWKKAFDYYKKYTTLKDSIFNETKSKQIAEMQTKYEVTEKEKKLVLLEADKKITDYKNLILIGSLIFLIALAYLLINRQILKTKRQKEIYQVRQQLVHTELVKNKLEKQNLETSLLHNQEKLDQITKLFKEKARLIERLQEQLETVKREQPEQQEVKQLVTTIEEYINPNEYWEEFITNFNLVHKSFFDQLKEKYPDLTRNELRLCALLKCNLGNKEIANVLSISPDSVKKSRTRLRKKLQLEVDENLTKYIQSLT